ncbi:hypothetical protein FXW78_07030 [Rhodococcus opacus]|nr:hypothetical protein [Rhodococcus opacus]
MTTPNGSTPSGSLELGQFAAWQAMTEEDAKDQMRAPLSSFQTAQDNEHAKWGGFTSIASFLSGLTSAFTGSSSGGGFFDDFFDQSVAQQQQTITLENKVESLLTGGTRSTFMTSGTWTNPGDGKRVIVACVQGGAGGVARSLLRSQSADATSAPSSGLTISPRPSP